MFSYAAAIAIATRSGAHLELDKTSGFVYDKLYRRTYQLGAFKISANETSENSRLEFIGGRGLRYLLRRISRLTPLERRLLVEDQYNQCFEDRFVRLITTGTVWLEGLFQSDRYFIEVSNSVRNEFRFRPICDHSVQMDQRRISAVQTPVALGVRLYEEANGRSVHSILGRDYYLNAAAYIAGRVANPHFFVFCSSRDWVENVLRLPYKYSVIGPRLDNSDAHKDMFLMTKCSHYIIPNSTFHWWGAWLSENINKLVVAPVAAFPNRDSVPAEWVMMKR